MSLSRRLVWGDRAQRKNKICVRKLLQSKPPGHKFLIFPTTKFINPTMSFFSCPIAKSLHLSRPISPRHAEHSISSLGLGPFLHHQPFSLLDHFHSDVHYLCKAAAASPGSLLEIQNLVLLFRSLNQNLHFSNPLSWFNSTFSTLVLKLACTLDLLE